MEHNSDKCHFHVAESMICFEQVSTGEYVDGQDSRGDRSNASPCCPVSLHGLVICSNFFVRQYY